MKKASGRSVQARLVTMSQYMGRPLESQLDGRRSGFYALVPGVGHGVATPLLRRRFREAPPQKCMNAPPNLTMETILMILRKLVVGRFHTNCYLVACEETREGIIIDPGADAERILDAVEELHVDVQLILLTHYHFDHVQAASAVWSKTRASLAIHHSEAAQLVDPPALFRFFDPNVPRDLVADRLLRDREPLAIGQLEGMVLHTPGHSPGGISLLLREEGTVFCGDTLFREGMGRTDFPGASHQTLVRSIHERLFALPDETVVHPGHGLETTIGHERRHNPWLQISRETGDQLGGT